MKKLAWLALVLCALAGALHANTIYVPDDFPAIQDAIAAAGAGDTILVRPGTYRENIDFLGKAITVRSTDGCWATAIDGGQPIDPDFGSVVIFQNGEQADSVIEGFSLINGSGTFFSTSSYHGGGIYCDAASSPTIRDNNISWNKAGRGGGIACNEYASPTIEGNIIAGNHASYDAGGILCRNFASPTIDGNVIRENTCAYQVGGIKCTGGNLPVISNNIISGNSADEGGGISCWTSSPVISGNLIAGNHCDAGGGGIDCMYGDPLIVGNRIVDNSAGILGGGAYLAYGPGLMANNIISGNSADKGGGVYCEVATYTFVGNTIVGNTAHVEGGGLLLQTSCDVNVLNTIFWNNTAPLGKEVCLKEHSGYGSVLSIGFSDLEGGADLAYVDPNCILNMGPGMLDTDPLFVDGAMEDFHLTWPSPCVNSGQNSAVTELTDSEGDPRIALGTVDMGADEFWYHLYYTGDVIPGSSIDVKVVGFPTAPVDLFLGSGLADPPYSTQHGDFWLEWPPLWQGRIGTIPGSGVLALRVTVPAGWPSRSKHPLQALVGRWGGAYTLLTNPMTLIVE